MSQSKSAQAKTETLVAAVQGMTCVSCSNLIERKLGKISGVQSSLVEYVSKKAEVTFDPSVVSSTELTSAVEALGYSWELSGGKTSATSSTASTQPTLAQEFWILLPMIVVSIAMMIWEFGSDMQWLPKMAGWLDTFLHHVLPLFAFYALFVVGKRYLHAVVRFFKTGDATMDTLVGIGTGTAFTYSFILAAFKDVLAPFMTISGLYYDVTIVVIGFITLGKYLEQRAQLQTNTAIAALLDLQPQTAVLLDKDKQGKQTIVAVESLQVGDMVLVKPGAAVPIDGEVISGTSSVTESMITGEPLPVFKTTGAQVIGGTLNTTGSLVVRVTQVGKHTILARIAELVAQAQASRAPIEQLVHKVSAIFVPVVLVFAVATLLGWLTIGTFFFGAQQAVALGVISFVGILVIACPCAMGLATPMALVVGIGKMAQSGILVKDARAVEQLAKVTHIVLDKTGTLTTGKPVVSSIQLASAVAAEDKTEQENNMLQLAASLEAHSEHPIAQAFIAATTAKKVALQSVSHFTAYPGKGVEGTISGKQYLLGTVPFLQSKKVSLDKDWLAQVERNDGSTTVFLAQGQKILAAFSVADTVRKDALETILSMQESGIQPVLVSGDSTAAVQHVAATLGISEAIASTLPEEKATYIKKIQQEGGVVAMIGDGINDSIALAQADVGIAMGTGTDVAIATADMTLLSGKLLQLPKAVLLAKYTMRTVKQNLFWAFAYNVVGIPIAAGFLYPFTGILLNPAIAGGAMAFSSVSVVLNALQLRKVRV